jgi:isopenicillin-N epimerase
MHSNYTLASDVTYLNHGGFGAVPKVVQEDFRKWQEQMESNPVAFMLQLAPGALGKSLLALAQFVGAKPQQLGFVSNATHGINAFARSLPLAPGDEVSATNQEYGATQKAMIYYCRLKGA